jgi:hypothetical protein
MLRYAYIVCNRDDDIARKRGNPADAAQTPEVLMGFSSFDIAIASAIADGSLSLVERPSRFGDVFVAICDAHGTIEVADDMAQAVARVDAIRGLQ